MFNLKEGWSTLILVLGMISVSAWAIVQSNLIDGLYVIPIVGILAVFTGLFLAKSRFPDSTSHIFSLIYGLFFVFLLVGSTLDAEMTWRERVFDLVLRQLDWLEDAFSGGTNRDGLIFVIQTSFVYWLLGYTAAWYTFRHLRVWRAMVPTGLVLLSVVYYYVGPAPLTAYLGVFTLLALLYIARTYLIDRENEWRAARVRYEKTLWFTFLRAAFLAAMVILLAAGLMPTFTASAAVGDAFRGASGPWREFQDDWTRLFSSLRSYSTTTSDPYRDSLVLGGPRSVGNTPIMDVTVPRELPYVYWQAIVYDTYDDGGWFINDSPTTILYQPENGFLVIPPTQAREVITQTVVNYLPNSSFLYAAPEIIATDRPTLVDASYDERGNLLVTALRSQLVLRLNDEYLVTSRVSIADATSLRNTSTNYPDWVEARYLQVPDSVTPETLELAAELTAPYETVFDKALAVRDHLRENIAYNDQIPAPPEGVDPVHYTLFESREGYCNYYASAMALMLRSQGVPARVVSGYAQGEFDPDTMSYRVRASNAHTWVEVFFPGYGWIQFEPTAAIPTVERPEGEGGNPGDAFGNELPGGPSPDADLPLLDDEVLPDPDFEENLGELPGGESALQQSSFWERLPLWQLLGALVVLAVAGILTWLATEMNRRVESDVTRSYSRLGLWARWLGLLLQPNQTPHERADLMTTAVPEGQAPIQNLTGHFVRKQFSRNQEEEKVDTLSEWRILRPLLWRQGMRSRWQRFPPVVRIRQRLQRKSDEEKTQKKPADYFND